MSTTDGSEPPPGHGSDALSARLLRGPLTAALIALALWQVACWLPHYLTWPWFADHDVFATAAQAWDAGGKPYRDLRGNNFPGTTYAFWVLGKAFGWGKTPALFAADAMLLGAFAGLVLTWSRRRLKSSLPGVVGLVLLLSYYLGLDYTQVAQRDWHAPLFAASALLLAQTWPGRGGWVAAAFAFAAALTIRPHPLLLLPAMASAIDEGARVPGGPFSQSLRAGLLWGLAVVALVGVAFAPIAVAGVLGDLVAGVRLTGFGNKYNRITVGSFAKELTLPLLELKILAVPAVIVLLRPSASTQDHRMARTWLLALAGAVLYRPISPLPHAYLTHPVMILWSINAAVATRLLLNGPGLVATARLAAILLILGLGATLRPRFCNPKAALEAVAMLRDGRAVPRPLGYVTNPAVGLAAKYDWGEYRDMLAYLRDRLPPGTRVANALKGLPAVTGPAARLPAFPAESLAWLRMVAPEDQATFAEVLEATPDSVVVWIPSEEQTDPNFALTILTATIQRLYEPDAHFGPIEIWRRKPAEVRP